MDEVLFKQAMERASQDVAHINSDTKIRSELPKPRTVTQVSQQRKEEKALEAVAPKTGYPDLDYILKGFIPGHLYTLTGQENVGKSSLACNFAVRVAKQGKKVLYFALEPENTVVDYIASVRFDKRFEDLTEEETAYDDGNIHIFGKEEVNKIDDMVKIVALGERYDLIIIDHIGYFVSTPGGTNIFTEQSNVIKKLAGLAKTKQSAIVMIAHLRKPPAGVKKSYTPTSNDISGSGAFKQDSTDVMIVTRNVDLDQEGMQYTNDGFLYVTKTKSGPNGFIPLIFSERKANITSVGEMREQNKTKALEQGFKMIDRDEKW